MLKSKLTKKKFYNKWLYKVTLFCPGIALYRLLSYEGTIEFLNDPQSYSKTVFSSHSKALKNKNNLLEVTEFLSLLDQKNFAKRIEANTIDIYINDKNLFDNISTKFESMILNRSEPDQDNLELLENSNFILAKRLPHKKYRYKAFLLPHKFKGDRLGKIKYLNWLSTQGDRILISNSVKQWFLTTDWYWDRRYLYVEDENTLLMLKMRDSQVLGKIYEYLIVDKY
jgi:hypothetical protein